jgi:4-carboxymuconolactone decarboxylase
MPDTARDEPADTAPRIPPLSTVEFTALVTAFIRDGVVAPEVVADLAPKYSEPLAVLRTLAHHPHLLSAQVRVLARLQVGLLAARAREIVILRVAWLTQCLYEWAHHHAMALECGLTATEIADVGRPGYAEHWHARDAVLLHAVDELLTAYRTTDATWRALETHYTRQQTLEVFALVSEYIGLACVLNSARVSLDELPDPAPLPPAARCL